MLVDSRDILHFDKVTGEVGSETVLGDECLERMPTAILCEDIYGYSRLMGEDEEATVHTLISHRAIIDSQIDRYHGRFVNSAGESVLAEFASVVHAANCAVEVSTALKTENTKPAPQRRMDFRIGVNLGDVILTREVRWYCVPETRDSSSRGTAGPTNLGTFC